MLSPVLITKTNGVGGKPAVLATVMDGCTASIPLTRIVLAAGMLPAGGKDVWDCTSTAPPCCEYHVHPDA